MPADKATKKVLKRLFKEALEGDNVGWDLDEAPNDESGRPLMQLCIGWQKPEAPDAS